MSLPRIAYLCSEYPAISHTFILREVEGLRELGVDIATFSIRRTSPEKLLSAADREAYATTETILPPRWRRLTAVHLRLALGHPFTYLRTLAGAVSTGPTGSRARLWRFFYFIESVLLWDECRRRGIRHVHVHFANVSADVAMLATTIGNRVEPGGWSWSFTMHGPTEFFDVERFELARKVRSARFVVCISDFARSRLMALGGHESRDKLPIVHVGVPIADFTRTAPASGDGDGDGPTILCVGRLVPEKGQAVLIEALARLLSDRPEAKARLVLIGDGAERGRLEELARRLEVADRVALLGAVGQDEIRAHYEAASVFCLPSFAEGVPVVLMEAMALEVPVLSTAITGIPELIEPEQGGVLVRPGSVSDLTAALERLLDDAALRRSVAQGGRAKVLASFDSRRSARQLRDIFAERLGVGAAG